MSEHNQFSRGVLDSGGLLFILNSLNTFFFFLFSETMNLSSSLMEGVITTLIFLHS